MFNPHGNDIVCCILAHAHFISLCLLLLLLLPLGNSFVIAPLAYDTVLKKTKMAHVPRLEASPCLPSAPPNAQKWHGKTRFCATTGLPVNPLLDAAAETWFAILHPTDALQQEAMHTEPAWWPEASR